jgi:hypothetical protein
MGKADGADAPERRSSLPFAPVVWPDCAVGASLIQSCESHGRPADQCGPQDGNGCDGVGDIPRKYGQRPHRLEWRPHRSFRNAATALAGAPPRGRYWPVCCLAGLPLVSPERRDSDPQTTLNSLARHHAPEPRRSPPTGRGRGDRSLPLNGRACRFGSASARSCRPIHADFRAPPTLQEPHWRVFVTPDTRLLPFLAIRRQGCLGQSLTAVYHGLLVGEAGGGPELGRRRRAGVAQPVPES